MVNARVVALRTLNYLRATHLPTYVALRALLESTSQQKFEQTMEAIVEQVAIRKRSRTLELRRFKSFEQGKYFYREYFVPSPSEALADSYAIDRLHVSEVLPRNAEVFSYRYPPDRTYGRNFEHFSAGYRERNRSIAHAISQFGGVAVVADMKSCYPSINGGNAVSSLLDAVSASSLSARDSAIIRSSAERALVSSECGSGLRVGSEMSHALANVYLDMLDRRMRKRYAGRYFRYVDDIVIVVDRPQVDEALAFLDEGLATLGLTRNHDKDAVADESEWGQYKLVGRRSLSGAGDCLAALKFRLKLFLARNPGGLLGLELALKEHGVFLPLQQLRQGSEDRLWRERVSDFLKQGWRVVLAYRFDGLAEVVGAAVACRREILDLLDQALLSSVWGRPGTVVRRWQVQTAKFAINRALYFASMSDLQRVAAFADSVPELAETSGVVRALMGDVSRLVLMSGPAVAAATQLMALRGIRPPEETGALSLLAGDIVSADLEAHLSLRGFGSFAFDASNRSDDLMGLGSLAGRSQSHVRSASLGYGAEVASLVGGISQSRLSEIAGSRFASREDVVLDALSLSSYLS